MNTHAKFIQKSVGTFQKLWGNTPKDRQMLNRTVKTENLLHLFNYIKRLLWKPNRRRKLMSLTCSNYEKGVTEQFTKHCNEEL